MHEGNFYALLAERFGASPAKPCLRGPGIATLNYEQVDPTAARIQDLFTRLGLRPGDRVAAQVEKSPMAVLVYLACLRAGLVYVPLNPAYTEEEVDYFLGDAEPGLFIRSPGLDGASAAARGIAQLTLDGAGGGSLAAALEESAQHRSLPPAAVAATDTAVIVYTSGTTGKPKGAMLSHGNLAANASTLYRLWGWRRDDVLLHALPIFHVHGLFVALHLALLGGSTMLFLPRFDAGELLRLLPEATVLMGVPTFYTRLLAQPDFGRDCCLNMRLFVCGSAPLLPQTFEEFERRCGHRILERYGMTETGMLASNPLQGERRPGSVGFLLPDVQGRVMRSDGGEAARGETGMLEVKGPNVFSAYWRMPQRSGKDFHDGYFITGDLAVMDREGRLSIVGRGRDLIISGGYNVYPREVEAVLDRQPGIRESAVFGAPHPDLGEGVAAALVLEAGGAGAFDEAALTAVLKASLAGYKLPRRFFLMEELPRNTMGKVQKKQLRERFKHCFE